MAVGGNALGTELQNSWRVFSMQVVHRMHPGMEGSRQANESL